MRLIFNFMKASEYISILIIAYITIISVTFTLCYISPYSLVNPYYNDFLTIVMSIIIGVVVLYIIIQFNKYSNNFKLKTIKTISIITIIVLSLVYILFSGYKSSPDTQMMMNNANDIINNNHKYNNIEYMNRFPYQSGMVLYLMILMFIFQRINYDTLNIVLQICNIPLLCITALLLILIAKEIYGDKAAKNTAFCLMLTIPIPLSAIQIYGNILSLPLMTGFILTTIKLIKNIKETNHVTTKYIIIIILLLFLMGFIKLNNIIVGIASTITMILIALSLISNRIILKNNVYKNSMKNIIILFLISITAVPMMILGENTGISIVNSTGAYSFTEQDRQKTLSFIGMGLSDESNHGPGSWLSSVGTGNIRKNNIKGISLINERIDKTKDNPFSLVDFLFRKTLYTWTDPTYGYTELAPNLRYVYSRYNLSDEEKSVLNQNWREKITDSNAFMVIIRTFSDGVNLIITTIAIIGIIYIMKTYKNDETLRITYMMPALIITGGFLFHLFWETKPEYAYTYFLLLIPYASIGINQLKPLFTEIMHKIYYRSNVKPSYKKRY